jgi:transcriptional regulator with XRE-family HTH domain
MLDKKYAVILLQKGMTQQEIADKMGVHQPKVSEWLRGLRTPNSKTIVKLADVLQETPEDLLLKLQYMKNSNMEA